MLDPAIGSLAFLLEGIIFFMLQEPEAVSRMGYIGKYITELFRGWAVFLSTVASLVFLFLPIFFPGTFKDSSNIPSSYSWGLSALCFLAANFIIWKREHVKNEAEPHTGH